MSMRFQDPLFLLLLLALPPLVYRYIQEERRKKGSIRFSDISRLKAIKPSRALNLRHSVFVLRLLALTLSAYVPGLKGVVLIEEPENGIHPRAVETVFQSLSSVYDSQILLATHSPVVLGVAEPEQVLCFSKTEGGATDIVLGSEHPQLRDWQRETDLGTLFAAGVLG